MAIRSLLRTATVKGFATAKTAPIYVDSDDNRVKVVPAGTGSAEVILQEAGGASNYERLITTRVLTAVDSGKIFGLALATGFVVTLPTLATGLRFTFIVEISPSGGTYIIRSAEGDNVSLTGGAADGAAIVVNSAGFTADDVNLVDGKAIIGDIVNVYSVGTAGWAAGALVGDNEGVTISG